MNKMPENHPSSISYKWFYWNILCDQYSYDWKTAPQIEWKYKVWDYRVNWFKRILSEKSSVSDWYCFVEMDKQDEFYIMWNNIVGQKLYECVYFSRPNTPWGIMWVYHRYKFKLLNTYKYYLNKTPNYWNENFALCAIFQELTFPFQHCCVIITHWVAWEKNESKRIAQVKNLFEQMKGDPNLQAIKNVIWCGDFNANRDGECVKSVINQGYSSVFDLNDDTKHTIVIDTVDEGMKRLYFDYIFTTKEIKISNQAMPSHLIDYERGMPNENFPSDHIYWQCDFSLN